MADKNKDELPEEPPKDDTPADPKDANQPPQLSLEQMESLAAQVTQTILKQLTGGGAKAMAISRRDPPRPLSLASKVSMECCSGSCNYCTSYFNLGLSTASRRTC